MELHRRRDWIAGETIHCTAYNQHTQQTHRGDATTAAEKGSDDNQWSFVYAVPALVLSWQIKNYKNRLKLNAN